MGMQPQGRPENEMQALMEAAPGYEPEMSKTELQLIREAVVDCIEMLTDYDRMIIDAVNSERIMLRELAERLDLSVTQAWRKKEDAYANLKQLLMQHQVIKDYLGLDDD